MKTNAQFSALRRARSTPRSFPCPTPAARRGNEHRPDAEPREFLRPGPRLEEQSRSAKELTSLPADKGVIILTWSGRPAARKPRGPQSEDAKGARSAAARANGPRVPGGRQRVLSLPSNELYAAMQTGAATPASHPSTSLVSFRLKNSQAPDRRKGQVPTGSCSSRC